MSERKIDIYNHVMPRAVADRIQELAPGRGDMVKRVTSIPMLYDIEARIRMMDRWPGYQQVLTLSNPPIETMPVPRMPPTSPALPMTSSRKFARGGRINFRLGWHPCPSTTWKPRCKRWTARSRLARLRQHRTLHICRAFFVVRKRRYRSSCDPPWNL